ncbi:predicted protein [Nematostella vectensis]|uniref:G-protein coupled receptors family 1 profile domain-containing protein n=1 Tax=Nematostella vectensis TaxID=45351 RepID=A7S798_NEMVE|nr:predicted protein [Nematostella vectensis]|eukprot:XP_001632520.1 predicted protein [Nematostella vectensis]
MLEGVLVSFFAIILAFIAVTGNSLVFVIITRYKSMHTAMNYLIANLAVLDAITGLFTFPNVLLERTFSGDRTLLAAIVNTTSQSTCTVWISSAGSPAFLVFIAFERYMAVVHPFSRRGGITTRRLVCLLLDQLLETASK